jgi:succinyl-CoA---D-citramalate CoA-transferase
MIRRVRIGDGTLAVPGVVPKLGDTPGGFDGGGPALGEHTQNVLRELGYDDAQIASLRERGIVG